VTVRNTNCWRPFSITWHCVNIWWVFDVSKKSTALIFDILEVQWDNKPWPYPIRTASGVFSSSDLQLKFTRKLHFRLTLECWTLPIAEVNNSLYYTSNFEIPSWSRVKEAQRQVGLTFTYRSCLKQNFLYSQISVDLKVQHTVTTILFELSRMHSQKLLSTVLHWIYEYLRSS
jgi:hypothetical protein